MIFCFIRLEFMVKEIEPDADSALNFLLISKIL